MAKSRINPFPGTAVARLRLLTTLGIAAFLCQLCTALMQRLAAVVGWSVTILATILIVLVAFVSMQRRTWLAVHKSRVPRSSILSPSNPPAPRPTAVQAALREAHAAAAEVQPELNAAGILNVDDSSSPTAAVVSRLSKRESAKAHLSSRDRPITSFDPGARVAACAGAAAAAAAAISGPSTLLTGAVCRMPLKQSSSLIALVRRPCSVLTIRLEGLTWTTCSSPGSTSCGLLFSSCL